MIGDPGVWSTELPIGVGNDIVTMSKQYYVYIATNKINTVLYTGMTNDVERRMIEHKMKLIKGFTSKYNINKLNKISLQ